MLRRYGIEDILPPKGSISLQDEVTSPKNGQTAQGCTVGENVVRFAVSLIALQCRK